MNAQDNLGSKSWQNIATLVPLQATTYDISEYNEIMLCICDSNGYVICTRTAPVELLVPAGRLYVNEYENSSVYYFIALQYIASTKVLSFTSNGIGGYTTLTMKIYVR